ncbi:hypothetical protein KQH49_01890 [Mycetohabitans sp. B5]|uniref:Acid shock protein n=1 Tax=Mycetohabitans endofungorum TaxID=417203 RepID=A0A2P5KE12_9BURK|nr:MULTISPECIES: hypothetical protein [Mycetohabitans]MCG1053780.1 hypothetical protein [Mycetohabitans sp. B5]PPB84944.1 hypothetical protein B0O95_10125 [Mycetohabitans endofungorum]
MNKLIAALIAGLFATAAFAQSSAPEASAPAAALKTEAHKRAHTSHKKVAKKAPAASEAASS